MTATRRLPPIWLMGLCNLPIGLGGAVFLVTVPQLLSAKGVPETSIAWVTATALISTFTSFLLAPVLDWRLSRRAYAIITAALTGAVTFAALVEIDDLALLTVLALLVGFAGNLNQAAVGGWLSSVTGPEEKSRVGAWLAIGNVGGFGCGAAAAILIIRGLPPVVGPAAVGLLQLVPIVFCLMVPALPADRRLGHESFRAFLRDVLSLLRRPVVRWYLFFFILPEASFALSNTLTGLGKDFGASEELVGVVAGIGVAIAGVVGCLFVPPLIRGRRPPEYLYLAIGAVGAVITLAQLALPLTPFAFALGLIEQNGIQAAALAVSNVMILRSNGEHNPLAATQYALLNAAIGVPLTYMQAVDGQAYGAGGLAGSYLADALLSLAACALLVLLLRRRAVLSPVPA